MSFFSSAGPATVRRPTPSSARDDLGEGRLSEPGRPGEQHVVERLAPCFRRVERDPELLLDALLPDEVVEPARAAASARSPRPRGRAPTPRRSRSLSSLGIRSANAAARVGRGKLGIDVRQPLLRLEHEKPSSTSASRATRWVGVSSATATTASSPNTILSFSSRTIRSAVFLPMPGIAWKRAESSRAIARRSSEAGDPETTARATLGPIPLTVRSCVKSRVPRRPRSRRAVARPRARAGRSPPSALPRCRPASARPAWRPRGSRRRARRGGGRRRCDPPGYHGAARSRRHPASGGISA